MAKKSKAGRLRRLGPTVRKLFCRTMMAVDSGVPVQQALNSAIREITLDEQGRRHATDLVYTYLRTELRLDFIAHQLFPKSSKLPELFLLLVKAAFCSLLFQPFAPAHAVVHETVSDIRALFPGLDRVANGALRNLQRMGSAPLEKGFYARKGDAAASVLSRYYSVPEPVVSLILSQYGEECGERLLLRSFERPCAGLRINSTRTGCLPLKESLKLKGALELPGKAVSTSGIYFPDGGFSSAQMDVSRLQAEGALSYQAAGSLCVLAELGLLEPDDGPVWDACAGFGGKTMALLEAGRNVVLATDLSAARLAKLPSEAARLGLRAPCTAIADAAHPPVGRFCGTIIADVPCSGLGVLARRPDIRRRVPDFAFYRQAQQNILQALCRTAEPGSTIAYITCTINKDENGSLVRSVCAGSGIDIEAEWQTSPDSPLEGMYGARLRVR